MMPSDEFKQYLALLRAALADDPADWPETAEALIFLLTGGEAPAEGEDDLLEVMSHAFQHGQDLQQAFPHFYQRLQRNPALREASLEILAMIEHEDE